MSTKLVIVTLVGAVSIAGAAAGGYVALRRNATDAVTASAVAEPAAPSPAVPIPVEPTNSLKPVPAADVPMGRPQPAPTPDADLKAPSTAGAVRTATALPVPPVSPVAVPASASSSSDSTISDLQELPRDPAPVAAPAIPLLEDLMVVQDSVIGIRLDSFVSSGTARVEDKVTAHVARDVTVRGLTAISAGARLEGVVTVVDRGSKFKDRARLGVRFQSLVMADGTRLPIQTETLLREGESPAQPAAAKVGASAAIGGILGAVFGGKKGAAIGSSVGAAGGATAMATAEAPSVVLPAGTPLTVRLTAPITITIEQPQDSK